MLQLADQKTRVRVFWTLFSLTIIMLVVMQITNLPLKTDAAPAGIITFELVGTYEGAQSIIRSWEGESSTWAGLNMGLDFLFLILYSTSIALACFLISDMFGVEHPVQRSLAHYMGWGALLAGFLDILENIALILLLTGSELTCLPIWAKWLAIPKFILVILSLVVVVNGVLSAIQISRKRRAA